MVVNGEMHTCKEDKITNEGVRNLLTLNSDMS